MNRSQAVALVLALSLLAVGCGSDFDTVAVIVSGKGQTGSSESSSTLPPESPPAVSESSQASGIPAPSSASSSSSQAETPSTSSTPPAASSQASASSQPPASSDKPAADTTGPAFSQEQVKAGDMTTVTAAGIPADELTMTADFSGAFKFFDVDGIATAFVGVSRSTAPGSYKVTVSQNGTVLATLPLTVLDAKFQTQSFQMDQGVADSTVNSTTARDEYNKMVAQVTDTAAAQPGLPDLKGFIMPIKQQTFKISSSYGFTRIVNGKVSGRHEGVDFPAPAGTPITATGAGKVIYSGFVQMTGNTVVIEHGMGLKSWYCHMSALDCQEGDWLEAGDAVGKVGTTGYSTGNHLHFGMSVNDIYTNPWQFVPYPG